MKNLRENRFFLILTLASILLAPNCATITRKSKQRIPVTSTPVGATVIVNGVRQGVTPLEIRLARKEKGAVIRIESPGYNPVEIRPETKRSRGLFFRNFLLGLIPGTTLALFWWAGPASESNPGDHPEVTAALIDVLTAAAFGAIFTAVDGHGAGNELEPKELNVTLTKADGTPRVNIIVVDADRFGDIKWIRVRRD
jgi:hypothetical protein